jgi:hypothetical protein
MSVVSFFFQKKKQKALLCFAEKTIRYLFPTNQAKQENGVGGILLFPEKEAKSVALLRREDYPLLNLAKTIRGKEFVPQK